jgi:SnoaL-like domain
MVDTSGILEANAAFYAAFLHGDVAALERLWADDDSISCIHPGWAPIAGRRAVLDSWRNILLSGQPQITCHEPYPIITGDEGRVLCIELLDTAPLAASNHFKRIDGVWRLVHHQSSPIAQGTAQITPDAAPPTGQIH